MCVEWVSRRSMSPDTNNCQAGSAPEAEKRQVRPGLHWSAMMVTMTVVVTMKKMMMSLLMSMRMRWWWWGPGWVWQSSTERNGENLRVFAVQYIILSCSSVCLGAIHLNTFVPISSINHVSVRLLGDLDNEVLFFEWNEPPLIILNYPFHKLQSVDYCLEWRRSNFIWIYHPPWNVPAKNIG